MANIVKTVEYVEITVTGSTAVSVNLTKSQNFANCVPFFAVNLNSSVEDFIQNRYMEVYMESGPKVTADRDNNSGTVVVGVYVVEFDSAVVTVQQGTFTVDAGVNTGTAAITDVLDTTKAFVIISYQCNQTSDDWARGQASVVFNSTTELGFARDASQNLITGRWFVVHTTGTDFSVEHISISMASTDETKTGTISAVTLNKTFVYNTYTVNENDDDVLQGGIVVDLESTILVRARRAFDSFGGAAGTANTTAIIKAQVVQAGGSEFSAERFECDWGDSLTEAVTVTQIDQTKAIVVAGGYQGVMSSTETNGGDLDGNYATMPFTSDTVMTGTRGVNSDKDGTTFFEVVEFGLSSVLVEDGILMAPYIPA